MSTEQEKQSTLNPNPSEEELENYIEVLSGHVKNLREIVPPEEPDSEKGTP